MKIDRDTCKVIVDASWLKAHWAVSNYAHIGPGPILRHEVAKGMPAIATFEVEVEQALREIL